MYYPRADCGPGIVDSGSDWVPVQLSRGHAFLSRAQFLTLCGAGAQEHGLHPDEPWVRPELITSQMAADGEAELVSADRRGDTFTMWWRIETAAGPDRWAAFCVSAKVLIKFGLLGLVEHTPV